MRRQDWVTLRVYTVEPGLESRRKFSRQKKEYRRRIRTLLLALIFTQSARQHDTRSLCKPFNHFHTRRSLRHELRERIYESSSCLLRRYAGVAVDAHGPSAESRCACCSTRASGQRISDRRGAVATVVRRSASAPISGICAGSSDA